MNFLDIRVEPGNEVISTVQNYLERMKIYDGSIISVIGAVDGCCISNMPKNNPLEDIMNEYQEPLEMSGNGEIRNGKPHIHCVMSREGESVLAGHLHWANVSTWYVNVYVMTS